MITTLCPSEELVTFARDNKIINHRFFQRLTSEPTNLTALWSFYANLYAVTDKVPGWLANLIVHCKNVKVQSLLSIILYDELGSGNPERVHGSLMGALLEALDAWKPETKDDPMGPGKILADEMARFFVGDGPVDIDFAVGSLISGEIYAEQMIFLLADEVRRQQEVPLSCFEWQLIHEEVESGHAETSANFTQFVPTSGPGLESVRRGATWKRETLWTWLDGIYRIAYD